MISGSVRGPGEPKAGHKKGPRELLVGKLFHFTHLYDSQPKAPVPSRSQPSFLTDPRASFAR